MSGTTNDFSNFNSVRSWYLNSLNTIIDNSYKIRNRFNILQILIFYWFLRSIISFLLLSLIYLSDPQMFEPYHIIVANFIYMIISGRLLFVIFESSKKSYIEIKKLKKQGYLELNSELVDRIKSFIDLLKEQTKIEEKISILFSIDSTFFPSIEKVRSGIAIILPMGLVSIFNSEQSIFKSILLHELGHVKHADMYLWRNSLNVSKVLIHYVFPFYFLSFLIFIISCGFSILSDPAANSQIIEAISFFSCLSFNFPFNNLFLRLTSSILDIVIGFYVLSFSANTLSKISYYRRLSEYLADFYSIANYNFDILEALNKYGKKGVHSIYSLHPKIEERISFINEYSIYVRSVENRRYILRMANYYYYNKEFDNLDSK